MDGSFDIIVVGGGTAGVVAAIQCGRAGMRTLLVEKNGLPGGTMTAAGISFPGLFFAWRRQIIAGIGWELV
ncbi:MAG: FAD-dependent oxidoreductase, partial [Lentisphaeria bacterium]|nr:FAD-dependent oxidoreductase [Lentisphaeria bacterium]